MGQALRNTFSLLDWMRATPLVKLRHISPPGSADVFVKLEEYNPGGSIKSRVALRMVAEAEEKGLLCPHTGQTLIEPTGGNTGVGLSIVGAVHGYNVVLTIPDNYIRDGRKKIELLQTLGANIILADSSLGNDCHVQKAMELMAADKTLVWLNQLVNPANPRAHYYGTGKEIAEALDSVDCFVAGVGSGGTLTGVSRRLREKFHSLRVIAVQPEGCDVIRGTAVTHGLLGFAIGMLPPIFDVSVVDDTLTVSLESVRAIAPLLARREGLFLGISSCANIVAAIETAKKLGKGKTVVTVAPDGGSSYEHFYSEQRQV